MAVVTTLSPSAGRGSHGGGMSAAIVIGIAVLALVVGLAAGWFLTQRNSTDAAPAPSVTGCPSPTGSAETKPLPSPEKITVDVFNATSRQGLAGATAAQLEKRGFGIGDVANDPLGKTIVGTAEVRYGKKGKANAVVVAAQVPDSKLVKDKSKDKTVGLALGESYDGLATTEEAQAALVPTPSATC